MPKASTRAPLPTSSSDFALPSSSSSSPGASSSSVTLDDPAVLFHRLRRSSFLQKGGFLPESRLHSPLASAYTLHARRRSQNAFIAEESESDKDRMMTDSPNSSETHTPPLKVPGNSEEDLSVVPRPILRPPPLTPPRRRSSASMDASDMPTIFNRRLSFPLKPPRILNLLAESRPEDAEVKSEAAFQRLVASVSELPAAPRTPRTFTDRGRYPEEAGREENTREDSPSDDDEPEAEEGTFAFSAPPPSGTQPINIMKPRTPAGSVNGDDTGMSISETSSSFGGISMDIDGPLGSPLLPSMTPTSINQWRYTPPPTTSAVRSNKRKLEDRFDPYPSSSKRRAVSPSLQYLRDSHQPTNSSMSRANGSRLPIALPISIPQSTASSTTSSPTISNSYPSFPRGINITSSPTLRATLTMPSPILRPLGRKREEEEQREIEGAGEAVNGLNLGSDTPFSQPNEPTAQGESKEDKVY
ncbi:hypothetical protein M413DRAFT_439486 [Hebeloma cylindrosporum]|uniref:Uncharacterized protein n=1 Tax=Hebeloma cylindrosporum TaxID=76867 RepID=A0A0C2Z3J7_HEBCY|nr:hypothetical protein M413DRAFT_439486 [Hebeloma cylindrosporum h7]